MKHQFTLCTALLALGVSAIGTASGQPYYVGPRPPGYIAPRPGYIGPRMFAPGLPPGEIIAIVRAAGLVPLSPPVRRGPRAYVLVAAGRAGEQLRVTVDAYAGHILRVSPVVAMRPYGAPVAAYPYDPGPRGALVQREIAPRVQRDPLPGSYPPSARFDDGVAPMPPRGIPNARLANAPTAMTPPPAAKPQHAPLPRPRPSVAAAAAPRAQPAAPPPAVAPTQSQAAPAPAIKEASPSKPQPATMAPVTPLD